MQKPDGLTTFDQLNFDYSNKHIIKNLTPVRDCQFDPADCSQGRWLFQDCMVRDIFWNLLG